MIFGLPQMLHNAYGILRYPLENINFSYKIVSCLDIVEHSFNLSDRQHLLKFSCPRLIGRFPFKLFQDVPEGLFDRNIPLFSKIADFIFVFLGDCVPVIVHDLATLSELRFRSNRIAETAILVLVRQNDFGILEFTRNLVYTISMVVWLYAGCSMNYNGNDPVVKVVSGTYEKGIKLAQKAMHKIENLIERLPGIEKWAVEIICY